MSDAFNTVDGPIVINPTEAGGFSYGTSGAGTGILTFTPLNSVSGGVSMLNITSSNSDGTPFSINTPINNNGPTQITVPYGISGETSMGQVSITVTPLQAPTIPIIPGGLASTIAKQSGLTGTIKNVGLLNDAINISNQLNLTPFMVTFQDSGTSADPLPTFAAVGADLDIFVNPQSTGFGVTNSPAGPASVTDLPPNLAVEGSITNNPDGTNLFQTQGVDTNNGTQTNTSNTTTGTGGTFQIQDAGTPSPISVNNAAIQLASNVVGHVDLDGTNDVVYGNSTTINLVGDGSSATVSGGGSVQLSGNNQALTVTDGGENVEIKQNAINETIHANNSQIDANGLLYGNLVGDNNTLNDTSNGGTNYGVDGNNNQINASGNEYVFNGTGNINVNGSSDTLNVNTTNNNILMNNGTINTAPNVNENIGGSGLTVNADGLSGSLFGSDNTLNDASGNLDEVSVFGQDDIVNADNVNILEEQLTDEGYGDIGSDYYDDFGYDLTTGSSILNAVGTSDTVAAFDVANGFKGDAQVDAEAQQQAILASQSVDAAGAATTPVAFGTAWQPASGASGQQVVTFSFATGSGPLDQPFSSAIGSAYQGVVDEAMQSWSNATGLIFEQVADTPASDIRIGFGAFDTAASGILGYTATRSLGHQLSGAIVRIEDPNEAGISTTANGQQVYDGSGATLEQVALHEIGHALGFADDADPSSVMFTSSSSANQGLDLTDLVGAQMLYGTSGSAAATGSSSTSTNAGAPPTGFAQMVQAMATFSPQGSSDLSAAQIAAVNTSLAQQLAAPLHH